MNKKIFMVASAIVLFLLPVHVSALTGSTNIKCQKTTLSPNESTTCTITGTSSSEVSAIEMELEVGANLKLTSINTDSSWQGDGEDGIIILYTDKNKTGTFDIGTFTVQAGNINTGYTSNVKVKEPLFMGSDAENFAEFSAPADSVSIRISSNINTLKSISIDGNKIDSFASNKTSYSIDVDASKTSITIAVETENDKATVTGDVGNKQLEYGKNTFAIEVKAENGSTNKYNIIVNRNEIRKLKSLKANDEIIELKDEQYEYSLTVKNDITSIKLSGELENADLVKFVEDYNLREINDLEVGNNEILIKIKDNNDDILTYKLTINRLDKDGNDVSEKNSTNNENPIENPKTGINNYLMIVLGTLGIVLVVYYKFRKHSKFPLRK